MKLVPRVWEWPDGTLMSFRPSPPYVSIRRPGAEWEDAPAPVPEELWPYVRDDFLAELALGTCLLVVELTGAREATQEGN